MDPVLLGTRLNVRHCSQCQGDTEFYCNTCKRDLCLQCKEKHVIDLHTKHHGVVIYREKFEYLPKQEPALLYDARKQQVGNEQLKLMSTPVLHTSVCVTGVSSVRHISRVMSDLVWVSDDNNLILIDTTRDTIHRVANIITSLFTGGLHTVNSSGELIYIDSKHNINKLSTDNKTVTILIQSTSPWYPQCVYCSPSTGDLMVGMFNYRTGKLTRYNSSGQHILTIEHDNTGHTLYSEPLYITENNNGDIIVSDWGRGVVVTERGGRHRFSYTGPPSGSSLYPRGICTDALSHILVCDVNTDTVQMIDKDGHFLSLLLTRQHGINEPYSLNYDEKTHLLWVGSGNTNTVSVYRYLQRRYSPTDDSVDDEKRIFKSTDDTNILEDTSKKTELKLMLSPTGKEKKDKTPISAKIIPDDLSPFIKATRTALEKIPPLSHYSLKSTFNPSFHPSLPGMTKKYPNTMTGKMITFNKKLEQLRENGEADIRIHSLVNSLNIETKFRKLCRSETINKAYVEFICNLDYLDCVGLDVGITMKPFNQYIEPFYGRRVNDFLGWVKDCVKVLGKTRSTQWGSVSSILFAIYAKEAILEFKPKELPGILDYSMRCAMENENYLLVFEIVRIYIFDHVIQLQRIFKDTKGVSPLIIDTILQSSRKMILRKFPNLQNNAIVLSFCWECGQGILNRMVMIMSYKGSIEITDRIPDEVMGFKLVLYNLAHLWDEASQVFKSIPISKKTPLPKVTESEARELFRKHSNLTLISASPYKSMGYSKGRHRVVEKLCISLFCLHKGYIPYGEEQFPKKISDVEVDVQEGYCYFGAGRSLELGGHINRLGSGSIGGFVDLPNSKVGLITCAHVVFSSEQLVMLRNGHRPSTNIEVEAFDKGSHSYKVCGKCVRADFPHVYKIGTPHLFTSASKDPNVDVALIEVDEDINTFEFRAVPSEQLQSAGFDPSNPPVFTGDIVSLPDPDPVHNVIGKIPDKLDSVVKYGAVTGFTIGNLYHSPVHVRFVQESLNLPGNLHSAIMCDQIEIRNLPHGQFFVCGDSGSFVFCINPDKTLSCLGMAVGLTSRESCLVTPIGRILENICPGARLKQCGSSRTSSQHPPSTHTQQQSNDTATSHATLQLTLGEMKKMLSDFQSSLQNVEKNVERNSQTLYNVETNLQNVQREVRTLHSQVHQNEDTKTQSSFNQSSGN
ncbi:uncharacterized protein LOC125666670 isoform X4 [Ostrea edulis]|uniref:uncharacterized protein LOC125666670 isoform X4 n=1 Tax=Ostrea edulis TaxID=37623 RepID=UPI0024AF2A66|nr:uncharacterized protein LOC125666670 isoform X4 [Ostrea edulis]